MQLLNFDEEDLRRRLGQLAVSRRTAFAAAIAERLLPAYSSFTERTGRGDPVALRELLDGLWVDLEGRQPMMEQERGIEICMGLIPGEDQYHWVVERSYAVDAAAAVVYALSCRKSGDVREAVWAAQTAYSALDRFVIEVFDLPVIDKSDEPRVLSHYLIQAEFSRQQRDLRELEAETDFVGLAERLRTRAKAESATVFSRASE